ncbi:MAG TPA: GDP-L-fucose synthase [Burkholderiales bacterium]|nr:GDP-L-fucose synthase [Burkholderiales bacterium]
MGKHSRIYVAGHLGMAGSAIVRRLRAGGYQNLLLRTRAELDLLDQGAVRSWMQRERPEYVFHAAGKVGGIAANDRERAAFLYENLVLETNVIHAAWEAGVAGLLFLGSSCIYPRDCAQPIREEYLLTGPLEQTNEPYAIAKIAGVKLCESYQRQYGAKFVALMPTNLYGPNDNYDLESSHVLAALLRKAHQAKVGGERRLVVWGSGKPRREFLHADDLADACVFVMEHKVGDGLFNVGTGTDITIRELAEIILQTVGLDGEIEFDATRPDGTPRKLLDVSRMKALGWSARIDLQAGIRSAYEDLRSSLR